MTKYDLKWPLLSGIEVVVETEWDWPVFCDIFVNHDYPLLSVPPGIEPVTILDLGANVGYFSLYSADICRRSQRPFVCHAIEALSKTYNILRRRTRNVPEIKTYHGAAGRKSGEVTISQSANHATSSLMTENHNKGKDYPAEPVRYLDLNMIVPGKLDILKMDIEGSEFDLMKNYRGLIKKAELVFCELHKQDGDIEKFRNEMLEMGFNFMPVVDRLTASVEFYYREK